MLRPWSSAALTTTLREARGKHLVSDGNPRDHGKEAARVGGRDGRARPEWVLEVPDVVVGAAKATSSHDHHRWTVVEPASLSPFLCEQKRELCDLALLPGTQHLSLPTPPLPLGRALGTYLPMKRNTQQTVLEEADLSPEVEN